VDASQIQTVKTVNGVQFNARHYLIESRHYPMLGNCLLLTPNGKGSGPFPTDAPTVIPISSVAWATLKEVRATV